jgi:hypothetical protein
MGIGDGRIIAKVAQNFIKGLARNMACRHAPILLFWVVKNHQPGLKPLSEIEPLYLQNKGFIF